MFPDFFIHKAKEVLSFLHIVRGKVTADPDARKRGVDEALSAMDKEREVYLKEKRDAEKNVDSDVPHWVNSKKHDSSQDISAI